MDFTEQRSVNGRVSEYQTSGRRQVTGLFKHLGNDISEAIDEYADDDTFIDLEESEYRKIKPFKNLYAILFRSWMIIN